MARRTRSGKGGLAKRGRNIAKCATYKARGTRERNKRKKVDKHLAIHPNDSVARKSI